MPYKDPNKQRAYQNAWLQRKRRSSEGGGAIRNNRRRTRAKEEGVKLKQVRPEWEQEQLEQQGSRCHWCGKAINVELVQGNGRMRVDFEADHVVPLAEGGEHSEANMVLACIACNRGPGGQWGRTVTTRPASVEGEVL